MKWNVLFTLYSYLCRKYAKSDDKYFTSFLAVQQSKECVKCCCSPKFMFSRELLGSI